MSQSRNDRNVGLPMARERNERGSIIREKGMGYGSSDVVD